MTLPQKRDYLEQSVGAALLWSQPIEEGLKAVLTYVFKNPAQVDPADPYKWLSNKRTLGRLVDELKKKVRLPEEFEEVLRQFVDDRNILVHRFFEHYDLYNPQDYEDAIKMIGRLRHNGDVIHNMLRAILKDPMSALKFEDNPT
ncbi:MAG: hypothetical protein ACT4OY_05280 [Alphaproteobacteria bacterium]